MKHLDTTFRQLSKEEEQEFKNWAQENYTAGEDISPLWHPVVRKECEKINAEADENSN